jgi:hypothetical protein
MIRAGSIPERNCKARPEIQIGMTRYGQVVINAIEGDRTILVAEPILCEIDAAGGGGVVSTATSVVGVVGKRPVGYESAGGLGRQEERDKAEQNECGYNPQIEEGHFWCGEQSAESIRADHGTTR